ncbi:MAG: glycosyltransferase family 4 protein [Rhodospirillales bacterium]|nr:glycosyltransferase family 4 protein [Rhodospirillales bacterium]
MNVAFYAPLKPPTSPVPSGDRRIARAFVAAMELAGHRVELASIFRSREPNGVPERQVRLAEIGANLARRLIRRYQSLPKSERPNLWFTYHLYYKAPDWIGPIVAEGLDIPYAVAEVSYAPKRAGGPWDISHRAVGEAIKKADVIFGVNSANAPCVLPLLDDRERYVPLKPFLEIPVGANSKPSDFRAKLAARYGLDTGRVWLLAVAMMRDDAKLQSYRLLATALGKIPAGGWSLIVAGDGPAGDQVRSCFKGVDAFFAGELSSSDLFDFYHAADLFVWPAINEAYGMALLEAQAAGLAAIVGDAGGVGDIVRHGETGLLVPEGDADAFAEALARLVSDRDTRLKLAGTAKQTAEKEHGLELASRILDFELRKVLR